jgi:hypothetical protein
VAVWPHAALVSRTRTDWPGPIVPAALVYAPPSIEYCPPVIVTLLPAGIPAAVIVFD